MPKHTFRILESTLVSASKKHHQLASGRGEHIAGYEPINCRAYSTSMTRKKKVARCFTVGDRTASEQHPSRTDSPHTSLSVVP